jgi:hypothetical protein
MKKIEAHKYLGQLIEQIILADEKFLRNPFPKTISMFENFNVRREFVRLLTEAKIDQAIQKYADDSNMSLFLNELKIANVSPKYIPWLINQALKDDWPERIMQENQIIRLTKAWIVKINRFDKMLKLNQISVDKRDINQYENFEDLTAIVNSAEREYQVKVKAKQGKKEVSKIYEDENYLLIEPKSEEASCTYGSGTKWCISATDSKNYFDEYAEKGARFLFIIDKKSGDKDAIAFAGDIDQIEIYDAKDVAQKPSYIENKYQKTILDELNKFLGTVTHVPPFSTVTMNDIKNDPRIIIDYKLFSNLLTDTPMKGLEAIEHLANSSREGWTSVEHGYANQRIRYGIEKIMEKDIFVEYDVAKRLMKIYKLNPEQYPLTTPALKILATKIISDQEGVWMNYLIPLVFFPQNTKIIIKYFLEDPNKSLTIALFDRIIEDIDKLPFQIPNGWQNNSRRAWYNIIETFARGDADEKVNQEKLLQNLMTIGEKYNWDFVAGAVNIVK